MIEPLKRSMIVVFTLLITRSVIAQHVDILVFDLDGKVGVGQYNFDTFQADERRVHLARFGSSYVLNSPGFTSVIGIDPMPGNQDLTWEFLPLTVDSGVHTGYRSTLLYWDGTGEAPEFGPTGSSDYKFWISGTYGTANTVGSDQIEPGSIIATTPPNGSIHEHPDFFLDDGDGVGATVPDAGIYVLGLRFDIDGLEQSDAVYMVWATPELSVLPAIQPAAAWVRERVDTLFVDASAGDFDGDGDVDGADFLTWQRDPNALGGPESLTQWATHYGVGASASIASFQVPEPTSLLLASSVCLALFATKRRSR